MRSWPTPPARAGGLERDDVVVVAQKAVSKVEGRVVHLEGIEASERALELAGDSDAAANGDDPSRGP